MPFDVFIQGPQTGWWVGGAFVMILFWGAVILLVLLAMRHFGHVHEMPANEPGAIDTLKMRFARGEIDEDEFQRRANLIKNTH
jgi:putative membrane protein